MKRLYVSKDASSIVTEYLREKGYDLKLISTEGIVDEAISGHPDIFLCKMGIHENAPIFFAGKGDLKRGYPGNAAFDAACTGKYFIHNLLFTNERLLSAAKGMGMILINVRQGYTKCSTVVVDEHSLITCDKGIAKACGKYEDLKVLKISSGFIRLKGYGTGFIGGCSGRVGREIIFHGDLSSHPDFKTIVRFIEKRGLTCRWFPQFELTDIGSIL